MDEKIGSTLFRGSRSQIFFKLGIFKNFRIIHRKTPVLESLFNKGVDLNARNLIKKRLQHRHFPVNIEKFSRTAF